MTDQTSDRLRLVARLTPPFAGLLHPRMTRLRDERWVLFALTRRQLYSIGLFPLDRFTDPCGSRGWTRFFVTSIIDDWSWGNWCKEVCLIVLLTPPPSASSRYSQSIIKDNISRHIYVPSLIFLNQTFHKHKVLHRTLVPIRFYCTE